MGRGLAGHRHRLNGCAQALAAVVLGDHQRDNRARGDAQPPTQRRSRIGVGAGVELLQIHGIEEPGEMPFEPGIVLEDRLLHVIGEVQDHRRMLAAQQVPLDAGLVATLAVQAVGQLRERARDRGGSFQMSAGQRLGRQARVGVIKVTVPHGEHAACTMS